LVSIAGDPNSRTTQQGVQLYTELIDEDERLDPDRLRRWLGTDRSPRSIRILERLAREKTARTYHVLLFARYAGRVVGFLKCVFAPAARVMFVAYVGAAQVEGFPRGSVMAALASFGQRMLRRMGESCRWVVFEVTCENRPPRRVEARCRLFRDYASIMGLRAYRVDMPFRQPDLDPLHKGLPQEREARLFVIPLWEGGGILKAIPQSSVATIVSTVYMDIYGETFEDFDEVHSQYRRYLRQLYERVISTLPERVPLL
jgi:hypothetical protein